MAYKDIVNRMDDIYEEEEKDMGEEIIIARTFGELVKAIKGDHKWANETATIFENEMPDFQSPEEKAFLNGVKFATRKYMDILKTNGVGGYEND